MCMTPLRDVIYTIQDAMMPTSWGLPTFRVTPRNIFSNEIPLLDVNFFNPGLGYDSFWISNLNEKIYINNLSSTAHQIRSVISKWYQAVRDIAIVLSLSILVYIGIRIIISSTSADKAKYKERLVDWVISLCLIFVMHYIMSFSMILVDGITKLVSSLGYNSSTMEISEERVKEATGDEPTDVLAIYKQYVLSDEEFVANAYKMFVKSIVENNKGMSESDAPMYGRFNYDDNGDPVSLIWFTQNEMETARIESQIMSDGENTFTTIGYKVIYCVLVVYTIIFLVVYLKRVVYMAFLTMIAPLVAMTYAIDKINDGQAQAFNAWLKEYIFNLLIQPMHLVIYTILIGSALEFASQNFIYTIVALGFMMPAEKMMRKFFGFAKADTPGTLSGAAGAAVLMGGMNKLLSHRPRGGHGRERLGKSGDSESEKEENKVNTHKSFDTDNAFDNNKIDDNKADDNKLDEGKEKTNLQNMSDADYENDFLDADMNDRQALDFNARDAYANDKGMEYSDEEMKAILGIESDEEYAKYMNEHGSNDNEGSKNVEIQINESKDEEQPEDETDSDKDTTKESSKGSIKKAIGRSAKMYGKGMLKKAKNAHLGRRAIRTASGLALGATAGVVGGIAGIASGDPSKAFQYMAAGTAGGYASGKRLAEVGASIPRTVANAMSVEGVGNKFKEELYGKEQYERKQFEAAAKEKRKDDELKWKLQDKLGDKSEKYRKKEYLNDIMQYGDFDNKTLVAMAEMQEKYGYSSKEAIAAALISDRDLGGKNYKNKSAKEKKEFKDTIRKRGEERKLTGKNLDDFTDKTIDAVKTLDSLRYK